MVDNGSISLRQRKERNKRSAGCGPHRTRSMPASGNWRWPRDEVDEGSQRLGRVLHGLGRCDRFILRWSTNDEYADLARSAIAALCRKRPSSLASGNLQTWGCAVLYALGQVNFLSDKSTTPYMAMTELCAHFGIAPSTGGNKAKLVRKTLGIRQFDHKWTLPSRLADSSLPWLIAVDGLVVDARRLPVAIQEVAVQKGLIPYLNPRPEDDTA